MKINEVTVDYVLNDYLHDDPTDAGNRATVSAAMPAAKTFIMKHTSLTEEEINEYDDLTFAYLIIIEDLYDNHTAYTNNVHANRTLDTILSLHSKNAIG